MKKNIIILCLSISFLISDANAEEIDSWYVQFDICAPSDITSFSASITTDDGEVYNDIIKGKDGDRLIPSSCSSNQRRYIGGPYYSRPNSFSFTITANGVTNTVIDHSFGEVNHPFVTFDNVTINPTYWYYRSNTQDNIMVSDICGNASFQFDNIDFLDNTFYFGTSFLKIEPYVYHDGQLIPGNPINVYLENRTFTISEFFPDYKTYLGDNVTFYLTYYWQNSTVPESFIVNSPQTTATKLIAHSAPDVFISLEQPKCYGYNGTMVIDSFTPFDKEIRYLVYTMYNGTRVAKSFGILTKGRHIGIEEGTYKIIIYSQDHCVDSILHANDYIISNPPSLNLSTSFTRETCPATNDGTLDCYSANYTLKDAMISRDTTIAANTSVSYNFYLTATGPVNFTFNGIASTGYPLGIADITGPSFAAYNISIGYMQSSNYSIASANAGQWTITVHNGINPCKWTTGYRYGYSPYKAVNEHIVFQKLVPYYKYTVTVSNANNCTTSAIFSIAPGIRPVIDTTLMTRPLCLEDPSGIIPVHVTNSGSFPGIQYKYILNDNNNNLIKESPLTTNSNYKFIDRPQGTYKVIAATYGTCQSVAKTVNLNFYRSHFSISLPQPSPIKSTTYHIKCTGGIYDGSLTSTPHYPNNNVKSYKWYKNSSLISGATLSTLPNPYTGNYYVEAKDDSGCIVKSSLITLNEPAIKLAVSLKDTSKHHGFAISCKGSENGWIWASASGGVPGINYSIDNFPYDTATFFPYNKADKYTIRAKDFLECEDSFKVTLHEPSALKYNPVIDTHYGGKNISCFEKTDGIIRVNPSQGVKPYTIQLYDSVSNNSLQSNTTGIFTGLMADTTYLIKFKDANNCKLDSFYPRLTRPAPLAFDTIKLSKYPSGHNISCLNSKDGTITVKTKGGTFPHKVIVTRGSYNATRRIKNSTDSAYFNGLSAGAYSITLSDTNSCNIPSVSRTLIQPATALKDSIITDHFNGYNIRCHDMTGWARIIASGGTGEYKYKWLNNLNKIGDSSYISGLYPDVIYRDSVFDKNRCTTTHTITLTDPELLQITNINTILPKCWYSNDGEIFFSAINGVPVNTNHYLFKMENGATLMDSGTLVSAHFYAGDGNYALVVQDKNNCTDTSYLKLDDRPRLTVHLDSANTIIPSCAGGNDGVVSLYGENGQLFPGNNYIFNLHCDNTGYDSAITANTGVFDNLYAKNYEYSITDGFGCTDTGYYALVDNAAMTISLVIDSMIPNDCYNDGKASLKVRADGGVGGYKFGYKYYNINHGSDTIPTDTLNCFSLHNLNWNEYNNKNLIWYIFYLRDKNFKQGQEACMIIDTFYLPKVYPIEFDTVRQDLLCHNSNDGKIGIKGITGGTGTDYADWTFSWRKEKSTIIFPDTTVISNLSEGIYNLTVQDAAHCEKSLPGIKLTNPPEFTIQKISTVPTGCKTCSTGKVTYGSNSMGKANAYVYSIDNQPFIRVNSPVFPKTFSGLRRGWHSLAITTKENGCAASDSFYIPVQQPKLTYIGSLPAGIGVSNGSITLGLTGGTGNYTIKRVDSEGKPMKDTLHIIIKDTIYKITGLGKGIYSLVAYDDDSCSNTITDTIIETNQLTINAYASSATCSASSDGELDVDVQGSNLPFIYKWTNSAGAIVSDSARVVNALPGLYHIEVTDSAGTKVTATVTVDTLDQLQIEESADISEPTCFGSSDGYIGINVSGGSELYNITWSPTNTEGNTLMDVPAGDYSVIVKYKRNSVCNLTRKFHLSQPEKLSTKKVTIDKPVCFGGNNGTIEITMNGGTRGYYLDGMRMNGDSAKITNLQAGDTILHITDSRVCSFDTTINIGNPLQIQIDKVGRGIISCFDKSDGKLRPYIINANQPLVQWTDYHPSLYADSLSGLHAGTYNVLITDANGCKYTDTLVLDETPEFVFDHFDFTEPLCFNTYDGKIKANVSGGTMPVKSFSWSNGLKTDSAVKLNRGNYSVTVFDRNFCRIANTVTLSSPPALVLNIDAKKPLCFGNSNGQITLSASGGTGLYNFGCNNTSTGSLITGLSDNTYTLYVNDENGCDTRRSYRLGQPAPLNPIYSITNSLKCNSDCNGAIQLSASGGTSPYSVVWPDNNSLFIRTNLCSGTYNVKFADANSCYLYKSVPLSQPDPLTLAVSSTVLPTCFGGCNGALHLSANGGTVPYLISWQNGQSGYVANNICAGSYNAVVTDSSNCNYASTFVLPDPEKEEISGIQDNIRLCDGQDLNLDPGDWASCEWLENGAVISNGSKYDIKKAGTYTLNVISSKGCKDTKTFTVEYVKDLLTARFLLSGDAVAGEGVEIIDISWPVPDSINWIYNTDSVALLSSSTDRQNIIFQYPGVYLVRLVARTAQCVDEDAQYITIYATKDEYDKGKRPVAPEDDITELFLYPSPNKGTFTIEVTLKDQQKVSLDIYKAVEGKPIYNKALEGSVYYKEEINLSGQVPGVYSLVLTTSKQRKYFLFVII